MCRAVVFWAEERYAIITSVPSLPSRASTAL